MRVLDYYLSGIARTVWPDADVTTERNPTPGRITGTYVTPSQRGTDYRIERPGQEPIVIGECFRDAKANLVALVARAPPAGKT